MNISIHTPLAGCDSKNAHKYIIAFWKLAQISYYLFLNRIKFSVNRRIFIYFFKNFKCESPCVFMLAFDSHSFYSTIGSVTFNDGLVP